MKLGRGRPSLAVTLVRNFEESRREGRKAIREMEKAAKVTLRNGGDPSEIKAAHRHIEAVAEARKLIAKILAKEGKTGKSGGKLATSPEAPFGVKADGTPAKKRGRKSKAEIAALSAAQAGEASVAAPAQAVAPSAPALTPEQVANAPAPVVQAPVAQPATAPVQPQA